MHFIDVESIRTDDFDKHITECAKMLLKAIAAAGKIIFGKGSEKVIRKFVDRLD